MLQVLCSVTYIDTGEHHSRVIDWDNCDDRRTFAQRADKAIRNGGIVTTQTTELPVGYAGYMLDP